VRDSRRAFARAFGNRWRQPPVAEPPPEPALLRSLSLFADLPQATIEQLAESSTHLHVSAGKRIVRRGDRGDAFYVIVHGEVEVLFESHKRALKSGEFFGEIALLRDIPRTGTVCAKCDVELLELPADVFLAAVTGRVDESVIVDSLVYA
jgi:CRP-like cAMP-binding protein